MILYKNISDCSVEVTKWATIVSTFKNISTSLKTINTTNTTVQTLISSLQNSTSEILSKTQAHYADLQLSCSTTSTTTPTTKVTWPKKTSKVPEFPKYTTVFGVPVFGDNKTTVSTSMPAVCSDHQAHCRMPSSSTPPPSWLPGLTMMETAVWTIPPSSPSSPRKVQGDRPPWSSPRR